MRPIEPTCNQCNDTGWKSITRDNQSLVVRCDCQKIKIFVSKAEHANIPSRYIGFELNSLTTHKKDKDAESQKKVFEIARNFVAQYPSLEKGLLFQGKAGVGKTRILCCMANDLIKKIPDLDILYIDWNDFVREVSTGEPSRTRDYSEFNSFIERLADVKVLIFDELGATRVYDWVYDYIYYIFNKRYNNLKITLCATNFFDEIVSTPEENAKQDKYFNDKKKYNVTLVERVGERIRSRLYEMTDTIKIFGIDRRTEL